MMSGLQAPVGIGTSMTTTLVGAPAAPVVATVEVKPLVPLMMVTKGEARSQRTFSVLMQRNLGEE